MGFPPAARLPGALRVSPWAGSPKPAIFGQAPRPWVSSIGYASWHPWAVQLDPTNGPGHGHI
jgi:hypothetical protein